MKRHLHFSHLLLATVSALAVTTAMDLTPVFAQEAESLGTILVTDTQGKDDKSLESSKVIDSEELEALNALTVSELFASTPSITVSGGSPVTQKFYLHGLEQTKVNIVIDGARQRTGIWHHVAGDVGIEPEFLKRVDVKSGISPADAGPGALAGTVEFETKDAKDLLMPGQTIGGMVSAGFRSNSSTYQVTGAGYGMHNGFEFVGMLKRAGGDNYEEGGGDEELGTETDVWSGLGKFAYEAEEGHRFEASGEHHYDNGERQLRANMNITSTPPVYNDHTGRRTTLTAKYTNTKATGWFDPELQAYLNINTIDRPYGGYSRYSGDFKSEVIEFGGKALNTFNFEKGTVTAGFDFYHNEAEIERFYYSPTHLKEEMTNFGALIQARFKPVQRLELSFGARVDHQRFKAIDGQTINNTGFSPNAFAAFELIDGLKAKVGASSVFGGLEASEMALYAVSAPYTYESGIDPARAHNFKAGLAYKKNGFSVEAGVFYTRLINPMANDYTNWPFGATRIAGPDAVSKGFELSARYDWEAAFVSAAFTHTDVEYDGSVSGYVDNTSNTVGDILNLQGAYTFKDIGLTIGALAQIAFDINEDSLITAGTSSADDLEGYSLIDVYAEYEPTEMLKGFKIRADVTNLLDEKYAPRSTRVGGARGPTTWDPVHGPGRSFNISASKKF